MAAPRNDEKVRPPTAPPPGSGRQSLSIICGVLSLGVFSWMVYGMVDVADISGDAFGPGWSVIWMLLAAVGFLLAAAAVVLWSPPNKAGVAWKAVAWVAGVLVLVFGAVWLFGPVF